MVKPQFMIARDMTELHDVMNLVRRSGECVICDSQSKLQCPSCGPNQVCQFTVPVDCTQCPKSICRDVPSSNSGGGGSDGPSAGPIAGGVVGGIAAIAIITYLVWRFLIKPKRRQSQAASTGSPGSGGAEKDATSRITRRSSTHTVHSIASTVLTRASNIIQIAYIPGVTNRAAPNSPDVLVPPVPPIPMHHSQGNHLGPNDQHFFVPGNLRDSTYSGISGYSDRTSYARTSFAPRSSIASTIYGKQAQVLAPAQTGMRAKPTVVSVKPGSSNGSATSTPPVPSIDFEKYTARPKSSASNFSVGSTFLSNANTATQTRAQVVKVGTGLRQVEIAGKSSSSSSHTLGSPASPDQSPFSDPPSRLTDQSSATTPSTGPVIIIESEDDIHKTPIERGPSPFSDEHATSP